MPVAIKKKQICFPSHKFFICLKYFRLKETKITLLRFILILSFNDNKHVFVDFDLVQEHDRGFHLTRTRAISYPVAVKRVTVKYSDCMYDVNAS